jgi:hypothetical protein
MQLVGGEFLRVELKVLVIRVFGNRTPLDLPYGFLGKGCGRPRCRSGLLLQPASCHMGPEGHGSVADHLTQRTGESARRPGLLGNIHFFKTPFRRVSV